MSLLVLLPPAQHPTSGICGDGEELQLLFVLEMLVEYPNLPNQGDQAMSCLLCETLKRKEKRGEVKKKKSEGINKMDIILNAIIHL